MLNLTLERIGSVLEGRCYSFRLTFQSVDARLFLPYPEATQLRFRDVVSGDEAKWLTRNMVAGRGLTPSSSSPAMRPRLSCIHSTMNLSMNIVPCSVDIRYGTSAWMARSTKCNSASISSRNLAALIERREAHSAHATLCLAALCLECGVAAAA